MKCKVLFINNEIKSIRSWIKVFIGALMVSGFKAIPFEEELKFLCRLFPTGTFIGEWFGEIYTGIQVANKDYPFLA